ncbi:MAG: helicase-related protein, partial [Solirubrobacteraceae bacterium]
ERQTLFFSATLDGDAGGLAKRHTRNARLHEHGPSARRAAAEVEHRFVRTSADGRVEALVEQLSDERDLALVFVRTKHGADRLVKRLDRHGVRALAMHGNKSQRQRENALAQFESGAVDTLVATDVAARGIDVGAISHVINYDLPHDSDTYVHRVGRTGRAGRQGVGITLVADDERRLAHQIASGLGIDHGLGGAEPSRPARRQASQGQPPRGPRRSGRQARRRRSARAPA